jgi:hypothetical protein
MAASRHYNVSGEMVHGKTRKSTTDCVKNTMACGVENLYFLVRDATSKKCFQTVFDASVAWKQEQWTETVSY